MTLYLGKHIRTDFLYQNWAPRTQCWVDVCCYLFLFLPGIVMFIWLSMGVRRRFLGLEGRADDDLAAPGILVQIDHSLGWYPAAPPGNLGTSQIRSSCY